MKKKNKQAKRKKEVRKQNHFLNSIKKMWRRKSYLGLTAMICVVIALLSASTFAWFMTTDSKENKFKTNFKYSVELVDEFKTPDKLTFDKTYEKKVAVKNTGDIPAFARVLIFPELSKNEDILDIDSTVKIEYNIKNDSNWILGEDGYYYYTKVIEPHTESEILFDKVSLSILDQKLFDEKYSEANLTIDAKLESVDYRKNEYRFSWWGNRDTAPTESKLKQVDDLLQKGKR
ncbi:hypothetical protein [Vagococcus sp.]|uniref:hypothetical protein n=1 Tax=Vagococcus sp. TaxID=1933889 RepID=UPI002FC80BEB